MCRKVFTSFLVLLALLAFSSIGFADGGKVKAESPDIKAGPQNTTKLGVPDAKTIVEIQEAYTMANWEGDLNLLIKKVNQLYPQFVNLVQNQEKLIAKPDGKPYKNLARSLNRLYKMLSEAIDKAGEQDPQAMKAIAELKELQKEVDKRLKRVEDYLWGPKYGEFILELTGEGRGIFDIELNNGQTVEVRYAVGCDRQVTPDVVDYPIVAVRSISPNQGNDRYSYAYGIALRGEETVLMQWDGFPMDLQGAKWTAQKVHNLDKKDWQFISCGDAECEPCSANAYDEDETDTQ